MLAYSTISHMGFMLLGLLSGVVGNNLYAAPNAYSSALFYAITYVLTTLGTFGVILLLSRAGYEGDKLDDLKGLNQRSPWFAGVMLILMLSLAGLPPTVGFYAKLSVLQAALATGQIWLPVLAVLFSLIGAFYYLRVVKLMYFDDAIDTSKIVSTVDVRIVLSLNGMAALIIGLWPGLLMDVSATTMVTTMSSFLGNVIH